MTRSHWFSILVTLSAFVLTSVQMISRYRVDELWGHLPMIQFLSAWLVFVFVIYGRKGPLQDRNWLLSCTSGLLLTLGFPPFPLPFLLLIGFVPLLVVLFSKSAKQKSWFFYCLNAFIVWNIGATFWVANTAYAAGIFANVVNSLLMTLPMLAFAFTSKKLGPGISVLAFVAFWIAFEFLHMRWELYWPWLTLGNGLSSMHWGVQWYEYTGTLGGSAWILAANYLIYVLWAKGPERKKNALVLAGFLLIPLCVSLFMYQSNREELGEEVNIVAIQPNFEPHYEEARFSSEEVVDRFMELSRERVDQQTDYLIFPETSFNRVDMDRKDQHPLAGPAAALLAEFPRLKLVTGLAGYRWLSDPAEQQLETSRRIDRGGDEDLYVEYYNCAIQLQQDAPVQEYYKALYVPGAEFFPFKKILFFMKPLVDKLGGSIEGYRVREKFNLFNSGPVVVTPAICYESIFGEFISHFVRDGSNLIFVMTNDGWWDNTAGHRQHADFAKLRAIEFRRSIARSANMGTCGFINQRGDFSGQTSYGEVGGSKGTVRLNEEVTFYAQWGDFIGRISLFFSMLLGARALVDRYRKK